MNIKDRMIMEDYRKYKDDFIRLGDIVHERLRKIANDAGILVMGIEHRVKSESSLEGKLYKNGEWYQKFDDLTDILGERVICYFGDEVDKFGKLVEQEFVIDWDNFSDKRALIKADTFGYLSLHYICSLPENMGYPTELCGRRFEIQIRTMLQHAWSAINHDLGYKNKYGVPREVTREFARLAGLMEIADDEFVRVRDAMNRYTEKIHEKITGDSADDVLIEIVSLNEYMQLNSKMQSFIERIAQIDNSEITYVSAENYVAQLKWLKLETIGDLQNALEKYGELAFKLAEKTIKGFELDILVSNAALRFICRAILLEEGYSVQQAAEFISLSVNKKERAERQAKRLFKMYNELKQEV